MKSDDALRSVLNEGIRSLGISVKQLAKASDLSLSTMYKLLSGKREPNLRTVRAMIRGLKQVEGIDRPFVAIVASREVLSMIRTASVGFEGKSIAIKEYPVVSVEDAIISAIEAQEDGAGVLVCAPIIAQTAKRLLTIPTVTIQHSEEGLMKAIRIAVGKMV